ncbi:MAG: hypothetical protein KDE53_27940, partial [Caldilineaceae bacterium]|nr:hypothetical protein [Caldilineaceae bacterium]
DLRTITSEQGGKQVNETIEKLAQLAWDGNLKGQTLAKNSLMMPLDHCFEKVQMMQPPLDKETLRAVTITDIYSYLERIRDDGMVGQETQRKAKAFVDAFFDELWGEKYSNNRQRLLSDEKLIRSAFLFHIREILAKRSAEKMGEAKAKTQDQS